ncbi:hypothetical protein AB0B13_07780 [Streptomyces sp. NPDC042898]|uniref:hypothetical protein n=1 Tax=unclassified Streptomyces TaxID=2593676 RepID=UPI00332E7D8F
MRIKETFLSACAVAALLAGTAACTSDGDGPADKAGPTTAAACKNGTYTWFNVDKKDVLTGISEKQKIGKGGGDLATTLKPLHTPRTAVTFEKGARGDAKAALLSLGRRVGEVSAEDDGVSHEFANVRRQVPSLVSHTRVTVAGSFVDYAWVEEVTGDFRYTCGTEKPVTGRAVGWTIDGGGVLECSEPVVEERERHAMEAALLACGPDAPAAKGRSKSGGPSQAPKSGE